MRLAALVPIGQFSKQTWVIVFLKRLRRNRGAVVNSWRHSFAQILTILEPAMSCRTIMKVSAGFCGAEETAHRPLVLR